MRIIVSLNQSYLFRQSYSSFVILAQDVIEHDDIKLDTMFKISIAVDICKVKIQ